jgi:hypothetical protein
MIKIICECGEKYSADEQHLGKKIQCHKCQRILIIGEPKPIQENGSDSIVSSVITPDVPSKNSTVTDRITLGKQEIYMLIGMAIIIILFCTLIYFKYSNTSDSGQSIGNERNNQNLYSRGAQDNFIKPTIQNQYNEQAQIKSRQDWNQSDEQIPSNPRRLPLGATPFGRGTRRGSSTLEVHNGTETDALVRVILTGSNEVEIRNFYIPITKLFKAIQIPPGNYKLKVAFGIDWDSQIRRFHYRKSFGETESFEITENHWNEESNEGTILHTEASNMVITLQKVVNGNFSSHEINEEEFWK